MSNQEDELARLAKRVRNIETQIRDATFTAKWSEWIPANSWAISSGTPVLAQYRRGYSYKFPNGSTNAISVFHRLTREVASSSQIYIVAYVSARADTSGNFYCVTRTSFDNDGELIDVYGTALNVQSETIAAKSVVDYLIIHQFQTAMSGSAKEMIGIDFERQGGSGSDSCTGDMDFYGMEIFFGDNLL